MATRLTTRVQKLEHGLAPPRLRPIDLIQRILDGTLTQEDQIASWPYMQQLIAIAEAAEKRNGADAPT